MGLESAGPRKEAEQKAAEMACQALDQLDGAVPGETAG